MTAIDELKMLLEQRGERYVENGFGITWRYHSDPHTATESMDGTLIVSGLTPQQAIDATLGRGECHDLAVTPDYRDKTEFKCSACGYEYSAVGGFGCDQGDEPDFNFCPNCGAKVVDA